jgi:ketosteroid isomerase-like protein
MTNEELIDKFYTSFAAGDAEGMISCYTDDIEFRDPAFGVLKGEDAKNMWRMLLKNPDLKVSATLIKADDNTGSASWVAVYKFSLTGRQVKNKVSAKFRFGDGKIVEHIDHFNFWKWATQAFGVKGLLLGLTPMMKNKVRKQALIRLSEFGVV